METRRIKPGRSAAAKRGFGPASLVRLRSGGPDMTVTRVGEHDGVRSAWCVWHDRGKSVAQPFALHVLERVKPASAEADGDEGLDVDAKRFGPAPCGKLYCRRRPMVVERWVVDPREGTERRLG